MTRRLMAFLLTFFLLPIAAPRAASAKTGRIGLSLYHQQDTFIASVHAVIKDSVSASGLSLETRDAKNNSNLQAEQVETLIKEGIDALILNPVDRLSAVYFVRLCKQANVPLVMINREPLLDDLLLYDDAYYIGTNPYDQGLMCGEIATDYLALHPESDIDGDGKLQYVLLKGEAGHQDAEMRSAASRQALSRGRLVPELLEEGNANWVRSSGQNLMSAMLSRHAGRIELVLSNNDDMALGAIDALKAAGFFGQGPFMPVVGVDATAPALDALKEGTLLGTVLNDAKAQGEAAATLAVCLAKGETFLGKIPYPFVEGRLIYVPTKKVTR